MTAILRALANPTEAHTAALAAAPAYVAARASQRVDAPDADGIVRNAAGDRDLVLEEV